MVFVAQKLQKTALMEQNQNKTLLRSYNNHKVVKMTRKQFPCDRAVTFWDQFWLRKWERNTSRWHIWYQTTALYEQNQNKLVRKQINKF